LPRSIAKISPGRSSRRKSTPAPRSPQDQAAPVSRELYLEVAVDVIKRLRWRPTVCEAIDPLKDELIEEFSHAADSFAEEHAD
jgi:hypothetical protein